MLEREFKMEHFLFLLSQVSLSFADLLQKTAGGIVSYGDEVK